MTAVDISLNGEVVLVAGAGGGGIGSAISVLLANAGARVAGIDRDPQAFEAIRQPLAERGEPHLLLTGDLLEAGRPEALIEKIEQELGPVRGLVNVVGGFQNMNQMAPLLADGAEHTFRNLLEFNLAPALGCSIAVARRLKEREQPGAIVNITSATGIVSMPYGAGYAAAKAALINLTRTMAVEWGTAGIRVNAVACGTIMSAEARRWAEGVEEAARDAVPLGRCGEPEEIAGAVLFLLSRLASYVSGEILTVDGGALARAPYNDSNNIPVFITDPSLHERLTRGS